MADDKTRRLFAPPPRLDFPFNELKTAQAAAYLIRKTEGRRIQYLHLIKLLYLADRKLLITRGQPLTGDGLYSMPYGPVLTTVCNFVRSTNNGREKQGGEAWDLYIVKDGRYHVAVDDESPTETDEMSRSELGVLDEVFSAYGKANPWDVVDMLHKKDLFPEWQDPGGSSIRIEPAEILSHAGWDIADIREVEALAKTHRQMSH